MDGKIVLLMIAVVAVGMFALPSTLALYADQHTFINGSAVDCNKCHGDTTVIGSNITNELMAGAAHKNMDCQDCHGNSTYLNGNNFTGFHAAVGGTVTCVGCHSSGAVPTTTDGNINVSAELMNVNEAHDKMGAVSGDMDDGCIACHTDVNVNGSAISLYSQTGNVTINNTATGFWNI